MKADPKTQPLNLPSERPVQPFRQLLEQVLKDRPGPTKGPTPPAPRPLTPRASPPGLSPQGTPIARIALATASAAEVRHAAELRQTARARVDAEAQRLLSVRTENTVLAGEATVARQDELGTSALTDRARVVELLTRELVAAFDEGGSPAANDHPVSIPPAGPTAGQAPQPEPSQAWEERASQAIALIEKIDVFVKSAQRPALELTLNNSLGARVEIERLGPKEVAIKLVGQRGPPAPETVNQLREALQDRGLKVAAMSVA